MHKEARVLRSLLVLAPYLSSEQAGAAQATITIVNALHRRQNVRPTVVSFEVEEGALDKEIDFRLAAEPKYRFGSWRVWRMALLFACARALRKLSLSVPDAVYTQSMEWALAVRSEMPDVPIISHFGHMIAQRESLEESNLPQPWRGVDATLAEYFERRAYRAKLWTHVVSTPLVAATRERHFGLPAPFFRVQPLCIDTERFSNRRERCAMRAELGIDKSDCAIITVARMVAWKNLHWLIKHLGELPEYCHLILVGDGVERTPLESLAGASPCGARIHFVGHRDPVPYLAAADVFALPSTIESFGVAYAEAMCMQLPCVGLSYAPPDRLTSAQDVIVDGVTGYIVANETELTAALTALAADALLRQQLGANAHAYALERFSADSYARFLEDRVNSDTGGTTRVPHSVEGAVA